MCDFDASASAHLLIRFVYIFSAGGRRFDDRRFVINFGGFPQTADAQESCNSTRSKQPEQKNSSSFSPATPFFTGNPRSSMANSDALLNVMRVPPPRTYSRRAAAPTSPIPPVYIPGTRPG